MKRLILTGLLVLACFGYGYAQQLYRMPDLKAFKHLTSKVTDRGGDKISMEYYSAPDGSVLSVYAMRGKTIGFSTHHNNDVQNTYKMYIDNSGNGLFQEVPKGSQWAVPAWARMP